MSMPTPPKWMLFLGRLETLLATALLLTAIIAASALFVLKRQHDQLAHLTATETVLLRGEALLDTLGSIVITESSALTPQAWRQLATIIDNTFAVRSDVQSISITRNGETLLHRQAGGLQLPPPPSRPLSASGSETEITQGSLEINKTRQPVFVITRTQTLPNGEKIVTEATFKQDAVGQEERTARHLVSSLFNLSVGVLMLTLALCAIIMAWAIHRDRRREAQARQEEHLAFSGVLANGILHDFRNPMSAVRLDAQMLTREMHKPNGFRAERVADLAERIAQAMGRMDKVFQEFLCLARPADEKATSVNLRQLIQECCEIITPRAEHQAVQIAIREINNIAPLLTLPFSLRRALLNVLQNAIYFSPRGSTITIECQSNPHRVLIDILDCGPGIPPQERTKIFTMFHTTRPEGTGLGLFLAHTALRHCQGSIEALPRKNGGTCMRITLPNIPTSQVDASTKGSS